MPAIHSHECSRRDRVALCLLDRRAPERIHRELGAFARYCVARIERELGAAEGWTITVDIASRGFTSKVIVHHRGHDLDAVAHGFDGPLAIWDAMCQIEQRLRENREMWARGSA
jgi:hypothetical protein